MGNPPFNDDIPSSKSPLTDGITDDYWRVSVSRGFCNAETQNRFDKWRWSGASRGASRGASNNGVVTMASRDQHLKLLKLEMLQPGNQIFFQPCHNHNSIF